MDLKLLFSNASKDFTDILLRRQLIKKELQSVLLTKSTSEINDYLISHNLVSDQVLRDIYSEYYELPIVDLNNEQPKKEVVPLLSKDIAYNYGISPYKYENFNLYIAIAEPSRLQTQAPKIIAILKNQKGIQIKLAISKRKEDVKIFNDKLFTQPEPVVVSDGVAPKPNLNPKPIQPVEAPEKPPQPVMEFKKPIKEIDLTNIIIPQHLLNKIPKDVAQKYKTIVFGEIKPSSQLEPPLIKMATVDPNDPNVKKMIGFIEENNHVLVDRYRTDQSSIDHALGLYKTSTTLPDKLEVKKEEESFQAGKPGIVVKKDEIKEVKENQPLRPKQEQINEKPEKEERIVIDDDYIGLSAEDIINKPTTGGGTSKEELESLARETELSDQDQDLDRLLRRKVASLDDLAQIFKGGVIPEIVAATLYLAIGMQASDVHIEVQQEVLRVRFRIDGILRDIIQVPKFLHAPMISRIKIMSKLKIDEQRVPQDGRFDVIISGRQVDVRVSTMPTVRGEKIVMRLLDKSEGVKSLEQLGVTGTNFDIMAKNINKPYGVILSTGPTGSGKSTTLYAILNRISRPGINIITLEDPVEYELPGINQVQVKPQIGFSFAEGLRSVLRQDPNVIMVGEIRDLETAALATHAALTGHLVLSTLHTNDASGALPRLINMGVEPFLITSSLNVVIGQRLVRKICENCRQKVPIPKPVLEYIEGELKSIPNGQFKGLDISQLVFYHGVGCTNCNDGYKGRIGIFEVMGLNDEIEELAIRKAPASELKKAAIRAGMVTMMQDGLMKAMKGLTTLDEIMRVTTTDLKELPGG